jgi:hypothetical protein
MGKETGTGHYQTRLFLAACLENSAHQSVSKLYTTFFFLFQCYPESYLAFFYALIRPITPYSNLELVSLPT